VNAERWGKERSIGNIPASLLPVSTLHPNYRQGNEKHRRRFKWDWRWGGK